MKPQWTLIILVGLFIGQLPAQNLIMKLPQLEVESNEEISLEMTTANFTKMVSVQFSIHWDPQVIEFTSSTLTDLEFVAVGNSFADQGSLRISWFDIAGQGKNLDDWSSFLKLNFKVIGEVGQETDLIMGGDSLQLQVFQATETPGVFIPIPFEAMDGFVSIIDKVEGTFELIDFNTMDVFCENDLSGEINLNIDTDIEELTYNWSGPNGFSSNSKDLEGLGVGKYVLVVADAYGNLIYTNTFLINQPLSSMQLDSIETSDATCETSTGSANILVEGGLAPYTYDIGTGVPSFNPEFILLEAGLYNVIITDANGCTILSNFEIQDAATINLDLGEDVELCEGENLLLEGGEYETYLWSNGSTKPEVEVSESGLYILEVTNDENCTAVDSVEVNFISSISLLFEQEDLKVCPGDSIELNVSGGDFYQWEDPTNSLSALDISNPIAKPQVTSLYTVQSEGQCGIDVQEILVEVFDVVANAGKDICIGDGEIVQLDATGGEHYYWSGNEYPLSSYNIPNPTAEPLDSTTYEIMIVDENGCTVFDEVKIFLSGDPRQYIKQVNIITPNGDGVNDVLKFEGGIEKYGTNSLKVFNRWGKIVYEKINYQSDKERFDGFSNGKELPAGTYYYTLSFRNDISIKQTLTVIKE